MTAPSEAQHVAAILAALTTAGAVPYEMGKVPDPAPDYYTTVELSRRALDEQRATVGDPRRGWRLRTRYVARLEANSRNLRSKASALEFTRLVVAGKPSTKVRFDTSVEIGDDDGWWTGSDEWTYVL